MLEDGPPPRMIATSERASFVGEDILVFTINEERAR